MAAVADRAPLILLGPVEPDSGRNRRRAARRRLSNVFWWAAVVLIGLLIFAVAPLLKRDRLARFWAAGMIFATIPVCATLPMDRLLTFVGIGAFGLLAQFWAFVFDKSDGAPSNPLVAHPGAALAWFFVAVHAVWAPLALPVPRRQSAGAVVGRGSSLRPRAAGSGDRRKDPRHRERTERRPRGLPHLPPGVERTSPCPGTSASSRRRCPR